METIDRNVPPLAARLLSGLLATLLIVEPIAANAQIVAASGAGRPTVESAQNGVPLVQIVAPNQAGVSHNVYDSYSVDSRGAVLNNSQVVVSTQQAGWIAGNPNLAGGSARIILNEVTGTRPSDLAGFTEVAGVKADVVIANPNGITCNGCGFINTGRGVLTTGTPVFGGDGSLAAFRVTGGTTTIGANGLEGRYADQIDLLARSVSVAGVLRANDLNVVAGANQVAYADLSATAIAGNGAAPATAIDVVYIDTATVGGMYANKIRLISTEAGVGVNNQGTLVALAGDFRLDAAGNITNGGAVAASDGLAIATSGDIANTGSLFGRDITVQAANLTNSGTGVVAAGNSANLYVKNELTNRDGALIYSGGSLAIAGDATRNAEGWLTTKTAYLLNSSADILAEGDIDIAAAKIDNKRTTFNTATDVLSTVTNLVQHRDGAWSTDYVGTNHINGSGIRTTTVTTRCDTQGRNCITSTDSVVESTWFLLPGSSVSPASFGTRTTGPTWVCNDFSCGYVTTTVTTSVEAPHGYDYWHVPNAATISTFSIQNTQKGRRNADTIEQLQDTLVSASAESRLIGRNVRVSADTLNNAASRLEASGDLTANVTKKVNNDGARLYKRNRKTTWTGDCSDIKSDEAGRLGWCNSGWIWSMDVVDSDKVETADSPASTITAAGKFILDTKEISNGVAGAGSFGNPGRIGNLGNPGAYLFGLPEGGLYTVDATGNRRTVVEADPRFSQYGNFIGSDYMLGLLGLDPMATEKRLGDAYYEQQMVRDQLLKLRGKTDYRLGTTLNTEYQALLESGAEFARAFNLAPGVKLTQEQVAALSRDIVWLETRKVAGQDVLVPVVYLGASYTPRSASALMAGGKSTTITAENIRNNGGTIAGEMVKLTAANDIVSESGRIEGQDVRLTAGRDIKIATATQAVEFAPGQTFTQEGEASRIDAQTLSMTAGNDLSLKGAEVKADSATLQAGHDLLMGSQEIRSEQHVTGESSTGGRSQYDRSVVSQRGSSLYIKTDLTLAAGNDLTVQGSQVQAGNDLLAYAGNNLNIVTARETETLSTSAYSSTVSAESQISRDSGQASGLGAGNNLTLVANNTLYSEGATLKAGNDATLTADSLVIAARHDNYGENSSYSNTGKRGAQVSQTQIQTDEATGSIVAAGGDLKIRSTGDTVVEGSALAAGNTARIDVSGDLKLLAAQSSRYQDLYRMSRGSKESTELKYHEERVSQLLTTITVGNGADIQVGGNFVAAIAEKNEDGSFKADRMTVDGIVRGDSRQQVDIKRTGEGASDEPETSQVLGDLKSAGIRNGAKDDFSAKATQAGADALQAYIQSGLIQVRNDPQVAAKLNRILSNKEGATLTYKDDTGKVSLTVAGQAKVQEVFNTLKVTETFDKKHFADAQTAMIVTLIVAIVLTICTAGAAGAVMAQAMGFAAQGLAATMINAAVIGMVSTMTGQLVAGASFDDAFQAGVKAGAISAVTAGIAYGAGEAVNSLNGATNTAGSTASAAGTGADTASNASQTADAANSVNTANSIGTVQSGSQTIEVGSKAAQGMNGMQKLTSSIWWEKTALNAVGQGAFAEAQGGSFKDGFKGAMIGSVAASSAEAIGDATSKNPFTNIVSHAALGCAVASASRQDCGSGALGGAASASLSRVLDDALPTDMSEKARDAIIAGGTVAGTALIASAAGKDMLTAANAAANEVTNNHLKHPKDVENRRKEFNACKSAADPTGCSAAVKAKYTAIYDQNETAATDCASRDECLRQADSLRQSQREYQARINELLDKGRAQGGLSTEDALLLGELQGAASRLPGLTTNASNRAITFGASLGDPTVANANADILISAAAGVGSSEGRGSTGTKEEGKNGGLKNPSGDTETGRNSERNQPYGNGESATPSPGTNTAGTPGGKVGWPEGETQTGKFPNLRPDDLAMPGPRYELIKTETGEFKYRMPSGELRTPKGTYDFVQIDGKLYVAPPKNDPGVSGHLSLSKGADVDYAGQLQFSQKGGLKSWNNSSGHYQPPASEAPRVKLPQEKFNSSYE